MTDAGPASGKERAMSSKSAPRTRSRIVAQFRQPSGALGHLAGWIMYYRPSNRARNHWLLDLLDIEPAHELLELGYGPGFALRLAAQRAPRGRIVGIDHSETMQRMATRRNAASIAAGRMRLLCGDQGLLGEFENRFDRIYSANALLFIPDLYDICLRMHRALMPGGVAAVLYQPRHFGATAADAWLFADQLSQAMRRAGFDDIRSFEGPRRPVISVAVVGRREQAASDAGPAVATLSPSGVIAQTS